jgi:hypothetical protein
MWERRLVDTSGSIRSFSYSMWGIFGKVKLDLPCESAEGLALSSIVLVFVLKRASVCVGYLDNGYRL